MAMNEHQRMQLNSIRTQTVGILQSIDALLAETDGTGPDRQVVAATFQTMGQNDDSGDVTVP